jgi:hypothetical protein
MKLVGFITEPEGSLPCSQAAATCTCPEPGLSIPHFPSHSMLCMSKENIAETLFMIYRHSQ